MSAKIIPILWVMHCANQSSGAPDLLYRDRGKTFRCADCLGGNAHNPCSGDWPDGRTGFVAYMVCDACADKWLAVDSHGNAENDDRVQANAGKRISKNISKYGRLLESFDDVGEPR